MSGDTDAVDEAVHPDARLTWVKDGVFPMAPEDFKATILSVFRWGEDGPFDGPIDVRVVVEDEHAAILVARFQEPNAGACFEVAAGLGRMETCWRIANTLGRPIRSLDAPDRDARA